MLSLTIKLQFHKHSIEEVSFNEIYSIFAQARLLLSLNNNYFYLGIQSMTFLHSHIRREQKM